MNITAVPQGTDEWKRERLGHVTASRISDVMAKVKTGEAKTREKYRYEIVTQRLTNEIQDGYVNEAMSWGTEQEPYARMAYEAKTGNFVTQVGFIKHEGIYWVGASPDGLVGDTGLIEIKCPNTATHLKTLESGKAPTEYYGQMQMQMWVTGREWCDFVSYDPRLPDELRYFCVRVHRDEEYLKEMEADVLQFLYEVEETIKLIKEKSC